MQVDVYEEITRKIVAAIEAGADDYRMPWHSDGSDITAPMNAVSETPYRGINTIALWAEALDKGYPTGLWATYRQWQSIGAHVRGAERSTVVVFWKFSRTSPEADAGDDAPLLHRRILARAYRVFNAAQVDGFAPPPVVSAPAGERIAEVEAFFANLNAEIRHSGLSAFYSPAKDVIVMPPFVLFRDPGAYYATLAHEATHWTGAKHRLGRDLKNRFGDEAYAMEELVAELGAAFTCAALGIATDRRPDHAAYIGSWLKVLHGDTRAIFTAASKAQSAAYYLQDQQLKADDAPELQSMPSPADLQPHPLMRPAP